MIEKMISFIGSAGSLILISLWLWHSESKDRWEPGLAAFTSGLAVLAQIIGYFRSRSVTNLEGPPHGGTKSLNKLFDFVKGKAIIIIKPTKLPKDYWRAGFKISSRSNISVASHLERSTALFTVEQTDSELTCSYHEDGNRIGNAEVLTRNYNDDPISISYSESNGSIDFVVKVNNEPLYSYNVPATYRYGRFVAFSDDQSFKISVKVITQ